jgi:hypothetical protein
MAAVVYFVLAVMWDTDIPRWLGALRRSLVSTCRDRLRHVIDLASSLLLHRTPRGDESLRDVDLDGPDLD